MALNFREKLQNRTFAFNFRELDRLSQLKCRETTYVRLISRNSRKFSAAKISDYTVSAGVFVVSSPDPI